MTPNGQDFHNWVLNPHTLDIMGKEYWGKATALAFLDAMIDRVVHLGHILRIVCNPEFDLFLTKQMMSVMQNMNRRTPDAALKILFKKYIPHY